MYSAITQPKPNVMYKFILRKILFSFDPEKVHQAVIFLLRLPGVAKILNWLYGYENLSLARRVGGLVFKNPVGLAAGFDKNAEVVSAMEALGFGFVEIGTVTPRPQPGNPKPRIFRLSIDGALINRMGFNNQGAKAISRRLRKLNPGIQIGGNIGKNKTTPNQAAAEDYRICFQTLYPYVDFFVVNVSSPNTPNLRELQEKKPLMRLLQRLRELNQAMSKPKPIWLKIAPDLSEAQLDDIIDIMKSCRLDALVATNTTISREHLKTDAGVVNRLGEGGLSGKPLSTRSTEVIRYLHRKSGGAFPIVGVGGIHSPEDAAEKLDAGASLVELYTGFIYEGPSLVKRIKKMLAA